MLNYFFESCKYSNRYLSLTCSIVWEARLTIKLLTDDMKTNSFWMRSSSNFAWEKLF